MMNFLLISTMMEHIKKLANPALKTLNAVPEVQCAEPNDAVATWAMLPIQMDSIAFNLSAMV
jgi:hypothetical protein